MTVKSLRPIIDAANKAALIAPSSPIANVPTGIPFGTLAIGEDGAINAALLAASIIGLSDLTLKRKLNQFRLSQSKSVKKKPK